MTIFKKLQKYTKDMSNKTFWIITVSLATCAGLLSFLIGSMQSIWFDESYSVVVAGHSLGDIIHLASLDTHPPLYYILLHFWGDMVNWNILGLRVFSTIALVGSLVVSGAMLRRMFGEKIAITALLVAIASPMLLRYGFEIRMYSLASLIGIGATYVLYLAKIDSAKRWLWVIYGILVALGMYVLYYLVFLWIAHLVWLVWQQIKDGNRLRYLWKEPWIRTYGLAVLLFLPWLITFINQISNGALAPIGQPLDLSNLIGILTFNTLYQPTWQVAMMGTVLFIIFLGALIYLAIKGLKNLKRSEWGAVGLLAGYMLIPVLILMLISFLRPMYVERYLSHVAIGLMLFIGVVMGLAFRKKTGLFTKLSGLAIGMVLIVGTIHLASVGNFNFQRMERPTVQQVAKHIGNCTDDDLIVLGGPYEMIEFESIIGDYCNLAFHSNDDVLRGGYAPLNKDKRQFRGETLPTTHNKLSYIFYGDAELAVSDEYSLEDQYQFGKLTVLEYSRLMKSK